MGKATSFLCGFLTAGVLTGAAVLFSTPKAGKELRHNLKEKWEDAEFGLLEFRTAAANLKETIGEFGNKGLPTLKQTVRDIQEIITVWREDIKPNLESLSSHLQELKQSRSAEPDK